MSQINAIRILIVDDHPVVREGLAVMIGTQPDLKVVASAATGTQAVELFSQHRPDITLMDLRLPGMNGIEAIRTIRQEFPDSRFIVVTTYHGDQDVFQAFQAGASSYILKEMFGEEMLKAIRTVHAGERYIPPGVASSLYEHFSRPDLTPRELDVLRLIVKGLSNKQIGGALGLTEGSIKSLVNKILGKLGVSDRAQAITTALQRGIVHLD
ncbi:MAG: response regulator transcription factor [Acidobacteria bacterium]|nr:response regulator transcription factor [Acidobacteriota bacterium]